VDLGEYFSMLSKAQPRDALKKVVPHIAASAPVAQDGFELCFADFAMKLQTAMNFYPPYTYSFCWRGLFGFMVRFLKATHHPDFSQLRRVYWNNVSFRCNDIEEGKGMELRDPEDDRRGGDVPAERDMILRIDDLDQEKEGPALNQPSHSPSSDAMLNVVD